MPNKRNWKRWREYEIRAVLEYMISSIQASGNFGFRTKRYYEKMSNDLQLDIPYQKLKNKIESIKSKYKDFVIWTKAIGAAIKDEDARAVASKKQFKWYVECQKLWGKDISIHPPYFSPSPTIGPPKKDDL